MATPRRGDTGSVDASREPDTAAEFAIYDLDSVELCRVPYDDELVEREARAHHDRMTRVDRLLHRAARLFRRGISRARRS